MACQSRRDFLTASMAGLGCLGLAGQTGAREFSDRDLGNKASAVPMIHVTDLFRPHNDPDDHWDLASVYSLAFQNQVDLRAVLIDYPQTTRQNNPDVLSVAQMNYLTGLAVPTLVGSPSWIEPDDASKAENAGPLRGIRRMLALMHEASEPVVINILGSCRDVAIAGKLAPDLFAAKCKAIYLNAGSGTPDPAKAAKLEWNVHLDPAAYATIFEIPCPVYWMPCFEHLHSSPDHSAKAPRYGTFYRFRQGDILPELSDAMQNYFAYMFLHGSIDLPQSISRDQRSNWLSYLLGDKNADLLSLLNAMDRNMWCTGGFLHAAGKTVSESGTIVPLKGATDPVFSFDPINVTCSPAGITRWQAGTKSPERFIFHVRNTHKYPSAMTSALKSLVTKLP